MERLFLVHSQHADRHAGPGHSLQNVQTMGKDAYLERLQWLESLKEMKSWDEVERSCAEKPFARIGQMLHHAANEPKVYRAKLLCHLGKAALTHLKLLVKLKTKNGPLYQPLQNVFKAAVNDGDAVLGCAIAVSQTAQAQVDLGICYSPFWQALRADHVVMWSATKSGGGRCASSVLHAHAKLFDRCIIPKPAGKKLQALFIKGLVTHADTMWGAAGARSIAQSCWALGRERIPFGQALGPIERAVTRMTRFMTSKGVSDTLWGFAQCLEPLGQTVVPLFSQLLHELEREPGGTDSRAPHYVSISLKAYGDLHRQGVVATVNQQMRDQLIATVQS